MLILLLLNFLVIYNNFLLAKYFFKLNDRIDNLLAIFILYFSQIVFTLEILGIFSVLTLRNVLILNALLLLAVIIALKSRKPIRGSPLPLKTSPEDIRFNIDNKIVRLCSAVILGFGIVKILINLINPPFGWDDLNYHFTFPVEWLKNHNLDNPISISGDPCVSYYPINASLFFLWFILPLKNVFLADVGQLPFFAAAFLAVLSLGKKLKISREYSFFAAVLFSVIPNYFKQLQIAYIDIIVASLFLIALNYLFLINKEGKIRNIILCSLAIGLVIGAKITALPISLLFLLPLVYLCFARNYGYRKLTGILAVFSAIIAAGGFSYIKNFIQTHNPFYPLNLKIGGLTIFKGVVDSAVYRAAGIMPGDFKITKFLFHEGLGGQTLFFVVPAIVLSCPLLLLRNRKKQDLLFNYLLILPLLIILAFRFVIPIANIRYIYVLFAIAMLIFFYSAELYKISGKAIKVLVVICLVGSMLELAKKTELMAGLVSTAVLFFTLGRPARFFFKNLYIKITIMGLAVFIGLIFMEKNYIKYEFPRYPKMVKYSGFWPDAAKAWEWLNNNTNGDNIAYIGRPVGFPLYGTSFKNNVYYVSVNNVEPAMLHYFIDSRYIWGYNDGELFRNFESAQNFRGHADYNTWLSNLKKKSTDFLFIYSELLGKGIEFPMEDAWAVRHPDIFKPVFINATVHIYELDLR